MFSISIIIIIIVFVYFSESNLLKKSDKSYDSIDYGGGGPNSVFVIGDHYEDKGMFATEV